jgi:sec-independent protein translocase protein TatA
MGRFGVTEILVILAVVLLLLVKIPELMKGLGSGIKEFKNAKEESSSDKKDETENEKKSPISF